MEELRSSPQKRTSSKSRWQSAVRQVLDEKNEDEDQFGDHFARLINEHPDFQYRPQTDAVADDEEPIGPLLSSRNLKRFYDAIKHLRRPSRLGSFAKKCLHYMCKDRNSMLMGLYVLGWMSLLAATIIAIPCQLSMIWMWKGFLTFWSMFSLMLIDVNEIKSLCPEKLLFVARCISYVLKWIDGVLLRGREYGGREWDTTHFVPGVGDAMSRHNTSLIKCPPPEDRPDESRVARSQTHLQALRFCHDMMQNAQKHTKRKLRKAAHTAQQHEQREESLLARTEQSVVLANLEKEEADNSTEVDTSRIDVSSSVDQHDGQVSRPQHALATSDDTVRLSCSDADIATWYDSDGSESLLSISGRGERPTHERSTSNAEASVMSDSGDDMNWTEVGARIGMRILSSEHVQRAVASQDTAERILDISKKVEKNFNPKSSDLSKSNMDYHNSIIGSPSGTAGDQGTPSKDMRTMITPIKPVHSMWTSAGAVLPRRDSQSTMSDLDDGRLDTSEPPSPLVPTIRRIAMGTMGTDERALPPRSPGRKSLLRRQTSSGSATKTVKFEGEDQTSTYPAEASSSECGSTRFLAEITGNTQVTSSPYIVDDRDLSTEVVLMDTKERLNKLSSQTRCNSSTKFGSPISKSSTRRSLLLPGVKVVVPMFPIQPGPKRAGSKFSMGFFQMATVVSCRRLNVRTTSYESQSERRNTNCLSITVNLDKSFLRDGAFAQMTLRVMDAWSDRYMPRHSKFPIGACVATTFGVGVLVGWRVEDDCHIVRALWQRRGAGSGNAYLNRAALHGTVEAAIGFPVDTTMGKGIVLSYVGAGREFRQGRYFILIKEAGRYKDHVLEVNRCDILACHGPEFVPVIELIREAAHYQIQVDTYKLAMRNQMYSDKSFDERKWTTFSEGFEILWSAFLKAVEEDEGFDHGVNEFFSTIISFLETLDDPKPGNNGNQLNTEQIEEAIDEPKDGIESVTSTEDKHDPYAWFVDDLFGGVFGKKKSEDSEEPESAATAKTQWNQAQYDKAYAVIRALMRTVTIARADCKEHLNLKLALSIAYEFLLFVRTVINIQQKNVSAASLAVWERAIEEVVSTFGPVQARLEKIGKGILQRIERQGNRAKVRIIRFVDIIVADETLLLGLERGEWDTCLAQAEEAFIQARIIDEGSRESYHRTVTFIMNHFSAASNGGAAARNNEKVAYFAKALKWLASPRRSLLKLVRRDSTLELLQRIFVRVFKNDPAASRMIVTHAFNIQKLRQLRMLKDFTISGKLWLPILDAADQEFTWAVSRMPESSKRIMGPLSKLFTLGVQQFHKIGAGDLTADWMHFLMQEEAIALIHKIDVELIISVESMSRDVREVMVVLPYYPSIDEDFLSLMDEVDIDKFLKEASDAIVDGDLLSAFIREKSAIGIRKFLDYLPKMSIPVEQRDLVDNWVITCRSEDGGDLTLSGVSLKRENLTCHVMGGESVFFQKLPGDEEETNCNEVEIVLSDDLDTSFSYTPEPSESLEPIEISVLDQIRDLILSARRHGCWNSGVGGVGQQPTDKYVASVFGGNPVTAVLNTAIELWRGLEIDDDELMEIAIKDVTFQIQLQQQREESCIVEPAMELPPSEPSIVVNGVMQQDSKPRRRFNPRLDPTLLFLEMKQLTVNLDKFRFRIEKKKKTIFDPVFEGWGSLSIQNASIKLRVECRKERVNKMNTEATVPVLHCQELDVRLENVNFAVKDTGADWILNKAVMQFAGDITQVVEANLKEQVRLQVHAALENLNTYFVVNPDLMLSILGITMDDLEENLVWV